MGTRGYESTRGYKKGTRLQEYKGKGYKGIQEGTKVEGYL